MIHLVRFAWLTGAAGVTFLLCVPWPEQLGFDPHAIGQGEVWRLASAHLTHLGIAHALINALGVGMVGVLLLQFMPPRGLVFSVAGTAMVIDAVFLLPMFQGQANFAGFSAILYGLATLAALLVSVKRKIWGLLIASAVVLALASDYFDWRTWDFDIATGTHLVGVACGMVMGAYLISSPRQSARKNS